MNSRTKRLRWAGNRSQTISKGFDRNLKAVACSAYRTVLALQLTRSCVQTFNTKDVKYCFGRLVDLSWAEHVAVTKHGRISVVVLSVKECKRLKVPGSDSVGEKIPTRE